jgi:hypothetical protein
MREKLDGCAHRAALLAWLTRRLAVSCGMPSAADAAAVVQRQLDAYNARDVDALLKTYADDAQLFEHPATPLARGAAELRTRFTARFQEPNLHAHLVQRIVSGSTVIDHERVTRTFPDGPGEIEVIMIYEVQGDRISRSWTIPGTKRLFGS